MARATTIRCVLLAGVAVGLTGCGDGEEGTYRPERNGSSGSSGIAGSGLGGTSSAGAPGLGGLSSGLGGGSEAGGTSAGGTSAGGTSLGGTSAGGSEAGGSEAGGSEADGSEAGGGMGAAAGAGAASGGASGGTAGGAGDSGGMGASAGRAAMGGDPSGGMGATAGAFGGSGPVAGSGPSEGGSASVGGSAGGGGSGIAGDGFGGASGTAGDAGSSGDGGGAGEPQCAIINPLSPTHPALNGVPVSAGGDRVSSPGSPYQAQVHVATDIDDGQPVGLQIGAAAAVFSVAQGGLATFPGVTLEPDGEHELRASCRARSGLLGLSEPLVLSVDTAGPDLAVSKFTEAGLSPLSDGDHFSQEDDVNALRAGLQVAMCGTTTSADALDLVPERPNFDVRLLPGPTLLGSEAALSQDANGACVEFDCPGGGPFDVQLELRDAAGNPSTLTRNAITCTAEDPIVVLVDPVMDAPDFQNPILAVDDARPDLAGAQYDVTACTNAPVGSQAVLYQGLAGGSMEEAATAEVEEDQLSGPCAENQWNLISFPAATLRQSATTNTYELSAPTALEVVVTDLNLGMGLAAAEVWVDTTVPNLVLTLPSGLCGSYIQSAAATAPQDLVFASPLASAEHPVTVIVTDAGGNAVTYLGTQFVSAIAEATVPGVVFEVGPSTLTAAVTEPSGNTGVMEAPCSVTVGSDPPPTVAWEAPVEGTPLVALVTAPDLPPNGGLEDADPITPGWQGDLVVRTNLRDADSEGVSVTFSAAGAGDSSPVVLGTDDVDVDGYAALLGVTLPEGMGTRLTATTSPAPIEPGTASVRVDVDVTPPGDPASFEAEIAANGRRATRFRLTWESAGDASTYDVRVSDAPIAPEDYDQARLVAFGGVPAPAGGQEALDVSDLYIENDYYFSLRAVDALGNRSSLSTVGPRRAEFMMTELLPPVAGQQEGFGWVIDGSSDLNGDEYSDLLVGQYASREAYLYLGGPSGIASEPAATFVGNLRFGFHLAAVGDLNGDGIGDLAISAYLDGGQDGATYVYYGRQSWPSQLDAVTDPDIILVPDTASDDRYVMGWLGYALARVGDFDGDGLDDFAVGIPYYMTPDYASFPGQIAIVLGRDRAPGTVLELPTAFTTGDAIRIANESGANDLLGMSVAGLGPFGGGASPLVLAAAPNGSVGDLTAAGHVYAIAGASGVSSISLANAISVLQGTASNQRLGVALSPAGDLGPGGNPTVSLPSPNAPAPGRAYLFSGMDEPFASSITLAPTETSGVRLFGRAMVGSVVPGTGETLSFIGSARSDVLVSSRTGSAPRVYLIDGTKINLSQQEVDVNDMADVVLDLPTDWLDFSRHVTALLDVDADTYGDIAVGESNYTSTPIDGRVRLFR